tara:strand:- start:169 stop:489 length:321 start_codon:yes stop_codon:yes gene_type:complete
MRENRLTVVTDDVNKDEYHSSEVLAAVQPQTNEVRLIDGTEELHCPFIVSAGIRVSADGENATLSVVTQAGVEIIFRVSPKGDSTEKNTVNIEANKDGVRFFEVSP